MSWILCLEVYWWLTVVFSRCPLHDYLVVWQVGWKIEQWEHTIGWSDAILKNRMESDVSDWIGWIALWLSISIVARNQLRDKYNKNLLRSVAQWDRGKKRMKSEQTWIALDYVCQTQIPSKSIKLGNGTPALVSSSLNSALFHIFAIWEAQDMKWHNLFVAIYWWKQGDLKWWQSFVTARFSIWTFH